MLTLEKIVDALTPAARAGFSDLYYQAQIGIAADQRQEYKGITDGSNERQSFIDALARASAGKWLEDFIELLIEKGIAGGEIVADYASREPGQKLHAMINSSRGYSYPLQIQQGIADATRYTAKVMYNGVATGTGVLIRPDLVLTAWHTLSEAFDQVINNGKLESCVPRADAAESISFAFDDILMFRRRGRPRNAEAITVQAAANWHVFSSPCHLLELAHQIPDDKLELDNYWDYVIVRLAEAPGLERRWAAFDERSVVPADGAEVYILQHPGGNNMLVDDDSVGGALDFSDDGKRADIRFIHYVNGEGGSSGAPCFDKSFSLFGIHQGAWPHPPARKGKANRGIAVTSIYRHYSAQGKLPDPDPANVPIWNVASEGVIPAIGCEEFQGMVWGAALRDELRVMVLRGDDGSGKSFLLDILNTMLPDKMHAKVQILAETVAKGDAVQFVEKICMEAHAVMPKLPLPEDYGSSRPTWREAVVRALVEALNAAHRPAGSAESRVTWLLFRDLNKPATFVHDAIELIKVLCIEATRTPALRIVLDGYKGDVPQEANGVTRSVSTTLMTAGEIEKFYRRLNAEHGLDIDTAIKGTVTAMFKTFQDFGIVATNKTLAKAVSNQALAWARKKKE